MLKDGEYYSLADKLRKEKKTTPEFEVMFNTLTLEEMLGLKLELCARATNSKLYGFDVYNAIPFAAKEAILMYSYRHQRTFQEGAAFLGLHIVDYYKFLRRYQIREKLQISLTESKQ
jgi:hypothetical protein